MVRRIKLAMHGEEVKRNEARKRNSERIRCVCESGRATSLPRSISMAINYPTINHFSSEVGALIAIVWPAHPIARVLSYEEMERRHGTTGRERSSRDCGPKQTHKRPCETRRKMLISDQAERDFTRRRGESRESQQRAQECFHVVLASIVRETSRRGR
jgi:hypothetical protein